MNLTIIASSRLNKILLIFSSIIAGACLIASAILALLGKEAWAIAMLVATGVWMALALIYAVACFIYKRKEIKQSEQLTEMQLEKAREKIAQESYFEMKEYYVPREQLVGKICKDIKWSLIIDPLIVFGLFGLWFAAIVFKSKVGEISPAAIGMFLLYGIGLFSVTLVPLFLKLNKLENHTPEVVKIYADKLVFDDAVYNAFEVDRVIMTSDIIINVQSQTRFKTITFKMGDRTEYYCLDNIVKINFKQPYKYQFFMEYKNLMEDVVVWCEKNGVKFTENAE